METKSEPRVSVLMTVFNQKKSYFEKAVESILDQTYQNFELLLVDDGSTSQECLDLIDFYLQKDSRIKLIRNSQNMGIIKSRNKGLLRATGKYVAILDSDDIAEKNRLEMQCDFMEKNPTYALCASWTQIIDEQGTISGKKKGPTDYAAIKNNILSYNFFTHSTCFFRKDALEKTGFYNEKSLKCEDYDLILRIIAKFPTYILPECLCQYRINSIGDSLSNNKMQEKYSLLARIRALREYGYPKKQYFKLLRPLGMYLFLPTSLKNFLLKNIWKNS